jgi:hypothetical protein
MNNFEPSSTEQLKQFFDGLRAKPINEIIALYGTPAREVGYARRQRVHWDGRTEIVEYRRTLGFLGTGTAEHLLWVYERSDGKLEFQYTIDLKADPYAEETPHPHPDAA